MPKNNLYICPKCHSSYTAFSSSPRCEDCDCPLQETTIEVEKYKYMNSEQKKDAKYAYLIEIGVDPKTAANDIYFVESPNTKWITFLMVCGVLAFIGYLIDAIIKMLTGIGFVAGVVSLVTGSLVLASTGVASQVVTDIHKIRNDVSRYTGR